MIGKEAQIPKKENQLNQYPDFSDIEDNVIAFQKIAEIARLAGIRAKKNAIAAGLDRTYVRNGRLIKISSTGKIINLPSKTGRKIFYTVHQPYTILRGNYK